MIKDVQEKKAIPILSGMVPTMTWNGDEVQKDFPFSDWARYTAENTAESEAYKVLGRALSSVRKSRISEDVSQGFHPHKFKGSC